MREILTIDKLRKKADILSDSIREQEEQLKIDKKELALIRLYIKERESLRLLDK
jgi:hypothetical protein